ncbi:SCO family protein [Wenjunlia tyrosinilytica]|jgi:protein SCO1/2|uniref:SCO family protein n=1 Tax=Wenjunlia tyrosinilytica TaxID=1544741 RepID=A0A917ZLG4_9ACTN|nr:SCO family protein [Wenjunlia tyrosinilytica]GGO86439.1 SCO family protein [Wenjunlia tyrosinilytica]
MLPSKTLRLAAATVSALALALTAVGCGSSGAGTGSSDSPAEISVDKANTPYQGTPLEQPFAKPDVTLTDTSGKPFDLRTRTKGRVTLLYFGYTHCPDVCPTTMSDLALAKQALPKADRKKVDVVMVTTDPDRDTPGHLRTWLDAMDKSFIGLTGRFEDIKAAARTIGADVAKPKKEKDGSVTVEHGAQVVAFSAADGKGHVLYTAGTSLAQFKHDMPLLVKGVRP